jgi:hypothetical protein
MNALHSPRRAPVNIARPNVMDRTALRSLTLEQRVNFLAALREIVGRRVPRNKVGTPLVSDFELIAASDDEIQEALKK